MKIQAPPNLAYDDFPRLLEAGIDDWGGVSPGDDRPREPGGALAGDRSAPRGDRGGRLRARRAPHLPRVRRRPRALGRSARRARDPAARRRGRARPRRPGRRRARRRRPLPAASRSPLPRRTRTLDEDAITALFQARGRDYAPSSRGRRPPARGLRRRRSLRRHPEHQLHERLLLPLRLLRILEGKLAANLRGRPTSSPWTRSSAAAARPGSAAPSRSASRAVSTPPSPASTTSRSAARSSASCPTCTSTRSPRSRSGRARRRSGCRLEDYLARA